jgi:circadian clock protein KaiC
MKRNSGNSEVSTTLPKTPTGIEGLDEITEGGLPSGRSTLVCGNAGCGKTLFAIQFLANGIREYHEPGVFMTFEETKKDLALNVKSLGIDLEKFVHEKKLVIDYVKIERTEIQETGEYDLEGLFIRLNYAIDSIGAKRVVLDTIESLFGGIPNAAILRSEIRRLFFWLKDKGVTVVVTGERGEKTLTRQGLEEYVSDCVILLDFRVINQISTRRLRIVKYRGSAHGTNEYPFLIDEKGISVLPITSLKLAHKLSKEIISTGLAGLDKLFARKGIYRGCSILISGTAGTAKSILSSYFALKSCVSKEPTLYFSFEESPDQFVRNMKTVGINFEPFIKSGLLQIHSSRPSLQGLEMHLLIMYKLIKQHQPQTVVVDPISSLLNIGSFGEVRDMLVRLIDLLKMSRINAVFTSLTHEASFENKDLSVNAVSSLADIWINLENEKQQSKRIRSLRVVKARGLAHENEAVRFTITNKGIVLEHGLSKIGE